MRPSPGSGELGLGRLLKNRLWAGEAAGGGQGAGVFSSFRSRASSA